MHNCTNHQVCFITQCFCVCLRYSWAGKIGAWVSGGGPTNFCCLLCCLSEYVSPKVYLIKALELTALWAVKRRETTSKQQHGNRTTHIHPRMHNIQHFNLGHPTLSVLQLSKPLAHMCVSVLKYILWECAYIAIHFVCPPYRDCPTAP